MPYSGRDRLICDYYPKGNKCKGKKQKGDGSNYMGDLPKDEMNLKSTEDYTLPHGNKQKGDKGKGDKGKGDVSDMPKDEVNLKSQEDYTIPHGNKQKGDKGKGDGSDLPKDEMNLKSPEDYTLPHGNKQKGDKGEGDGSQYMGDLPKDEMNLKSANDYSLPHGGKLKGDEGKLDLDRSNYTGEMLKDEMNLKAPEVYILPDEPDKQATPPVIYRWQDLDMSKLPKHETISKAWEDYPAPSPRARKKTGKWNKGKLNKEKRSAKPKVYEGDDGNKETPPLVNYIKSSEFARLCKMCPNQDSHRTFHCPNLTPGLKERFKSLRDAIVYKPYRPVENGCHFCLKLDHSHHLCPYQYKYPAGAIVGPFAQIVCLCCGEENAHKGLPGVDWDAILLLRPAREYPNVSDLLKKMESKPAS